MVSTKEVSPTTQSVTNATHSTLQPSAVYNQNYDNNPTNKNNPTNDHATADQICAGNIVNNDPNTTMSASTTTPTSSTKSNAMSSSSSTPKANPSTTSSTTTKTNSSASNLNLSKEEILGNTKIVVQGLETLRTEHNAILSTLRLTPDCDLGNGRKVGGGGGDSSGEETTNFAEEKKAMLGKSLEMIELGLGEAQVMVALSGHLQTVEAEKKKLRAQVRRLCEENAWLRDELANTQLKLQQSEEKVATLEEEKKHLEYMNSLKVFDDQKETSEEKKRGRGEEQRRRQRPVPRGGGRTTTG